MSCPRPSHILAVALLICACSRDGRDAKAHAPSPSPTAPKETHVLEVKSSADLENLGKQYLERAEAGFTGVLEVHVAPGTYEDTRWAMAPTGKGAPPPIDLVLEGAGAAIPGPSQLGGRSIRIEGLVLTSQQFAPIVIEATQSVTISKCAFIDGRMTNSQMVRPYLELRAHGAGTTKSPVTAQIDGTWFVRNFQAAEHSSLLAFTIDENEPGYFGAIAIRDSAFLGNAFSSDIAISYAKAATIERTIFYKTWPSGVFLRCKTAGAVAVKDSVLVAEELGHVAELSECPPIELTNTKIYTRNFTPAAPTPPALHVDRAALSDRTLLGDTSALDKAIAMPVAMPQDALRAALDQALHLRQP